MKTMRFLFVFAGALIAAAVVHSQAVDFVPVLKIHDLVQTDASTVSDHPTMPWGFEAFIDGTGLSGSFPSGPIEMDPPPAGSPIGFTFNAGEGSWEFNSNGSFASQSALDTAFANGTYNLTIGGINFALNLTGDFYPNNPLATVSAGTWSGGKLVLTLAEAAAGFTISTNAFSGFVNDGTFRIGIDGDGASYVQNTETFSTSSHSMNVAGGALTGGNTYHFNLEFNRIVSSSTAMQPTLGASALGIAAYTVITSFDVQVIPEPSTYAMILGVLALAGVVIHRRRKLQQG